MLGLFKSINDLIDRMEDILSLYNKDYIKSIEESREEVKRGEVFTHEEVFKDID